jgi:hypothetical protein
MESANPKRADISSDPEAAAGQRGKDKVAEDPSAPRGSPADDAGRKVTKPQLINRLNFSNFMEEAVLLHFSHRVYDRISVVPVFPEPCLGDVFECRWMEPPDLTELARAYALTCALVPRGQNFIRFKPEVLEMTAKGLRLALPEIGFEISHRKAERHACTGISVTVIQNSGAFSGFLLDFTATSFRVELRAEPPQGFDWIDPALPTHVVFFSGGQTFYSGECQIVRNTCDGPTGVYVLEPVNQEIQRYRKAEFRSRRQRLNPSPNMIFRHPLTRKRVELKIIDLSGSGFSVEEEEPSSVLLTGLILPEIELHFADSYRLACSAQVVFRRPVDPEDPASRIRCGLAVIDVKPQDHVRLLAMLHQVSDERSYVCNDLDLTELWDFFFETGFIYPEKYGTIQAQKELIKSTYEKLYTRCPDIARHFIYQENGIILGHLAMIRLWEESWLIHHHAARTSARNKAGLVVLDQTGRFGYDSHRLRSMHMDHVLTFYRPDNKFPNRIFGGIARYINDPKGCWVDALAYIRPELGAPGDRALPPDWTLAPPAPRDLKELWHWYEETSGGLMLRALDLEPGSWQKDALAREYEKHGFRRGRHFHALMRGDTLKALLVATESDIGINLSDLTQCTYVFVVEPAGLTAEILNTALVQVGLAIGQPLVPALISPATFVQQAGIPCKKTYNLWGLQIAGYSDGYFRYLSRIMKYV